MASMRTALVLGLVLRAGTAIVLDPSVGPLRKFFVCVIISNIVYIEPLWRSWHGADDPYCIFENEL